MSKSILVIDTPKSCSECELCQKSYTGKDEWKSCPFISFKYLMLGEHNDLNSKRHPQCPLQQSTKLLNTEVKKLFNIIHGVGNADDELSERSYDNALTRLEELFYLQENQQPTTSKEVEEAIEYVEKRLKAFNEWSDTVEYEQKNNIEDNKYTNTIRQVLSDNQSKLNNIEEVVSSKNYSQDDNGHLNHFMGICGKIEQILKEETK